MDAAEEVVVTGTRLDRRAYAMAPLLSAALAAAGTLAAARRGSSATPNSIASFPRRRLGEGQKQVALLANGQASRSNSFMRVSSYPDRPAAAAGDAAPGAESRIGRAELWRFPPAPPAVFEKHRGPAPARRRSADRRQGEGRARRSMTSGEPGGAGSRAGQGSRRQGRTIRRGRSLLTHARPFDAEVEMLIPLRSIPAPVDWERRGS